MNIHLLNQPTEEIIDDIMNDEFLNPTSRFILIEMIQNHTTPFNETIFQKQYPIFNHKELSNGFEMLVIGVYLKRIVLPLQETQFYLSPDKNFDEHIGLFN